ncbi:MAG: bifunctional riboflavin kinase/FAD synthetase [Chloroflexi bacterium]|nr:bifunctional riboflavin kinase/FAD synthetase [Chloroflexota bacterium]
MIHTHSLDDLILQNAWLTIGIFDGVHRGHREILQPLVTGAHAAGGPAVVLTFTPHPAVVLGGKTDFKYLTTPDELLARLESLGVDAVITQTFSREFADQTAEEFMRHVARSLGLRRLFIGYDTALGRGREGNAARLTEIGKELGYTVQAVPPLSDEMGIISSSRIRRSITAGHVSAAAGDLGRYYDLTGPVIHGDGRGHKIYIPTANIQVPAGKLIPANGIYACWAWLEGSSRGSGENSGEAKKHPAATNVGVRPTFTPDLPAPAVEAHLLDFNRDLYGQQVRLEFVEYLRPEEKFLSVEALVEQIQADIDRTREILLLPNPDEPEQGDFTAS